MALSVWAVLVLGIYGVSLVYVTVYCLIQFDLLIHYLRKKGMQVPLELTETDL